MANNYFSCQLSNDNINNADININIIIIDNNSCNNIWFELCNATGAVYDGRFVRRVAGRAWTLRAN